MEDYKKEEKKYSNLYNKEWVVGNLRSIGRTNRIGVWSARMVEGSGGHREKEKFVKTYLSREREREFNGKKISDVPCSCICFFPTVNSKICCLVLWLTSIFFFVSFSLYGNKGCGWIELIFSKEYWIFFLCSLIFSVFH